MQVRPRSTYARTQTATSAAHAAAPQPSTTWPCVSPQRLASPSQVRLAPGTTLAPGLLMRIVASDRNLSLVRYMYGGMTEEDMRRPATDVRNANNLLLFNSRLRSWSTDRASGLTTLELERDLAFDLRPFEWRNVQVHRFPANVLTEVRTSWGAGGRRAEPPFAFPRFGGGRL